MEDYVKEMNDKLHNQGYTPYELVKDHNDMLVAKEIMKDSLRLASKHNKLGTGYVQVIDGKVVGFMPMDSVVLIKDRLE